MRQADARRQITRIQNARKETIKKEARNEKRREARRHDRELTKQIEFEKQSEAEDTYDELEDWIDHYNRGFFDQDLEREGNGHFNTRRARHKGGKGGRHSQAYRARDRARKR